MPDVPTPPTGPQSGVRLQLRRRREGHYVAGVARGLADTLAVDVTYVRLAFVVLTLASGAGLVLYAAMWLLVPESDSEAPIAQISAMAGHDDLSARHGIALGSIVLGVALLLKRSGLWFPDRLLWPGVMIATGAAMVWRNDRASAAREGRDPWSVDVRNPRSVARAGR